MTRQLRVYVTPDDERLARELAAKRKTSVAGLFRRLLEEEALRVQAREEFDRKLNALTDGDIRQYVESVKEEDPWVVEWRERQAERPA
jgi:hypothetical protein